MAGKIIADTLEHSTAGSVTTDYVVNGSAKNWVNFNGTGTIATRDSLNVSTLTDVSTGQYTINLSSSMANGNYAQTIGAKDNASGNQNFTGRPDNSTQTSSLYKHSSYSGGNAYEDNNNMMSSIFGDLA